MAFILSGLIKLNDPLGLAYKLQEYFSEEVLNLPFLDPYVLGLALFVVIFEVVLGVFLLIGFKPKLTVIGLIGMIVFFTFLTFYSAYFDKVKDCGCFGDLIKLSPWGSFIKDLIFLAFLLPIFFGIKHVKPLFKPKAQWFLAFFSIAICAWIGYYVLNHLPFKDYRPYAIGLNITEGMSIPEDAPKPVIEYQWTYKLDGEEKQLTDFGQGPSAYDEIISVETKTIDEGYEPLIYDFSIESESEDLTSYYLAKENLIVIVSYSLEKMNDEAARQLKPFVDEAKSKGYDVIGLSASGFGAKEYINSNYNLDIEFYLCDEKALKAVVRANPGVLEINKGTVMQKVHWKDLDDFKL